MLIGKILKEGTRLKIYSPADLGMSNYTLPAFSYINSPIIPNNFTETNITILIQGNNNLIYTDLQVWILDESLNLFSEIMLKDFNLAYTCVGMAFDDPGGTKLMILTNGANNFNSNTSGGYKIVLPSRFILQLSNRNNPVAGLYVELRLTGS